MNFNLLKIKEILEGKYSSNKIDFINEYDFNDNYDKYYLNYILNYNFMNKNYLLSSFIIDIAQYKEISNSKLFNKLNSVLKEKVNYLVKLSIIDYYNFIGYKPKEMQIIDLISENKHFNSIVKMELIFLYLKFYKKKYSITDIIRILRSKKNHIFYIRFFKGLNRVNKVISLENIEQIIKSLDSELIKLKSIDPYYKDFIENTKANK